MRMRVRTRKCCEPTIDADGLELVLRCFPTQLLYLSLSELN